MTRRLLLLSSLLPTAAFAGRKKKDDSEDDPSEIKEINIKSSWTHGKVTSSRFTLKRDGKTFKGEGKPIDQKLSDALVEAIDAPRVAVPDVDNLGLAPEWVDAHMGRDKSPEELARLIGPLFKFPPPDNKPEVEIEVVLRAGNLFRFRSTSAGPFLLPWRVFRSGTQEATFNAEISRSVAAILPPDFVNRSRLAGESLEKDLQQLLAQSAPTGA